MATETALGTRGVYRAEVEERLPYRVFDADNHFYPTPDAVDRYLDPKMRERALLPGEKFVLENEEDVEESLGVEGRAMRTIGEHPVPEGGHGGVDLSELPEMSANIPIPGAMLNRLNPLRDLDRLSQAELIARYDEMRPAFEHKDPRLALMDRQGVQAAVVHAGGAPADSAFRRGDVEAGYAVTHAFNRWLQDDWGFAYKDRIFVPAIIPLVDPDRAVAELEWVIDQGARLVNLMPGPAFGRSPFDPVFDGYWARINEAGVRVAVHLNGAGYQRYGADWGEDPHAKYSQYNAFQWIAYWSDRPIMETLAAMMFHNLFGRFPAIKVLVAEYGTPWLPYLVRKMDHAALLGRRAKYGTLPGRPSQIFKRHVVVAPFPEENVARAIDVVGPECLVFGSDFPHSEGLPDPVQYASQLKGLDEVTVKHIMRDNLARFLALD
ncbi:MAG: amidohydrolase [Acidimicrobiaceae bacterium]|nr:amidohydrolase [Acidimicrobiaceae bacterium]